jgi:predicted flap endonuclease-1-like 5' DNA nuclease
MNPISERVLWFVLGLLAGWLSVWLASALRRRNIPPPPRPELHMPPPTAPIPASEPDAQLDYPHTPSTARLIDVSAARAAGFNMKHADDLTIIEGIGPKIEDLLRANGVDGFVQLARLNEQELLDMLERGGPSFRFANPATWDRQAALVVENRWIELKQLQRDLIGAR